MFHTDKPTVNRASCSHHNGLHVDVLAILPLLIASS
jgi:hypothetical protein